MTGFHHVNHNRRRSTEPVTTTFLLPQCPLKKKKKKKKQKTKINNTTINNGTASMGLIINDNTLIIDGAGSSGSDTGPIPTPIYSAISSMPMSLTRFIYTRLFFDDGTACMLLLILGYMFYYICYRIRNYIILVQNKRADEKNKRHRKKFVNSVNRKKFVNGVKNLVQMERVLSTASMLTSQTSSPTTTTPTTKKKSKILLTNSYKEINTSIKDISSSINSSTHTNTSTSTSFSCMKDPMSVNKNKRFTSFSESTKIGDEDLNDLQQYYDQDISDDDDSLK
mmetsp:Transcript_58013/g.62685  ORF Transcript_58013/g.62685 Transcript_58013/m.62685 type:complete len:281 (+) Transcript_58013:358-1200(+)